MNRTKKLLIALCILLIICFLGCKTTRYVYSYSQNISNIELKLMFWDNLNKDSSSLRVDIYFNNNKKINDFEFINGFIQIENIIFELNLENKRIIKIDDFNYLFMLLKDIDNEVEKEVLKNNKKVKIFLEYKMFIVDEIIDEIINENIILNVKRQRITNFHELFGLMYMNFNH